MRETLAERLPALFPAGDESTDVAEWIDAHQSELDALDQDLTEVKRSLQIAHATGDELDRIGADFGILGRRRGRDDAAYRQFLRSLVPAYSGRGTPPGLRTAIAAGVLADADDIDLIEDFDANRYEVILEDWEAHKTETVHTLADVADPSGVRRRDPLHYRRPETEFGLSIDETEATTLTTDGLSSSSLQPLSSGGTWDLP